jgi:hypothetical protein
MFVPPGFTGSTERTSDTPERPELATPFGGVEDPAEDDDDSDGDGESIHESPVEGFHYSSSFGVGG